MGPCLKDAGHLPWCCLGCGGSGPYSSCTRSWFPSPSLTLFPPSSASPTPVWSWERNWVQSVSGDGKLPVAARGQGLSVWEEGGEASLLSSHPSAVLPALRKAGTVCYTGAGMYRVFQMASVQSYTGCFLFILLQQRHPAVQHQWLSSAHLPAPLVLPPSPQGSQS